MGSIKSSDFGVCWTTLHYSKTVINNALQMTLLYIERMFNAFRLLATLTLPTLNFVWMMYTLECKLGSYSTDNLSIIKNRPWQLCMEMVAYFQKDAEHTNELCCKIQRFFNISLGGIHNDHIPTPSTFAIRAE